MAHGLSFCNSTASGGRRSEDSLNPSLAYSKLEYPRRYLESSLVGTAGVVSASVASFCRVHKKEQGPPIALIDHAR
jgi:hypothetical protein